MDIAIIGTGYVGLVTGTCFADIGVNVTCIDIDNKKIENLNQGILPIYEPGLQELVIKNTKANRLKFSTDLKSVIKDVDVVFIAVGTPTSLNGKEADMSQVFQAAKDIAESINGYKVIVTKSTVPVGTAEKVTEIILSNNPDAEFDVVSNPEFLREGSAISDFMNPDRIVIGAPSQESSEIMLSLYEHFTNKKTPIVLTNPKTSEIIKYAANCFLAVKICFINEVAQLCDACGANVQDVSLGIGLDNRIGKAFLNAGPGFGGSCFPKDINAFAETARNFKTPVNIVETIIESNHNLQKVLAQKIINACEGNIEGKNIGILGLAFKANTDDIRQSPAISIIKNLLPYKPNIQAYDPIAMNNAKTELPEINYCSDSYEAAKNADVLVIMTEWQAFCNLDFKRLASLMNKPMLIDFRNLYDPKKMMSEPVNYASIGRPLSSIQTRSKSTDYATLISSETSENNDVSKEKKTGTL